MPAGRKRKSLSKEIRLAVINKYGANCFYCGKKGFVENRFGKPTVVELESVKQWINPYDGTFIYKHLSMEFDHEIPLSVGGKDEIDNIVIACRNCNRKKGTKHG